MNTFTKIRTLGLVLFVAAAKTVVGAPEPLAWYQVEMVVFEHLSTAGILQETWPDDPGYPNVDQASLLIPPSAYESVRPFFTALFPEPGKATPRRGTGAGSADLEFGSNTLDSAINNALARGPVTSDSGPQPDTPFVQLEPGEFQLNTAAQRLSNSGRYRVLQHIAWRQPIQKGAEPVLLRFYSGEEDWRTYFETLQQQRQRVQVMSSASPSSPPTSRDSTFTKVDSTNIAFNRPEESALGPPPLRVPLDGTVGVRLSRYLHLEVDLVLQKRVALPRPSPPPVTSDTRTDDLIVITDGDGRTLTDPNRADTSSNDPDWHRFRLTESRRLRSKEVHYYDHPALGIIATIIPYTPK